MPSKSQAQHRLMAAAAAGKVPSIPKSVGREYLKADRGKSIKRLPQHKRQTRR